MPINAIQIFQRRKKISRSKIPRRKNLSSRRNDKNRPKHKGSENLLAELKTRLKKLREKEKVKKEICGEKGIKKEGFQFVLIGFPNSGKSSLLAKLTNARPTIAEHAFSTFQPELGLSNSKASKPR
jgi:ribosome-interacting GTPase 1